MAPSRRRWPSRRQWPGSPRSTACDSTGISHSRSEERPAMSSTAPPCSLSYESASPPTCSSCPSVPDETTIAFLSVARRGRRFCGAGSSRCAAYSMILGLDSMRLPRHNCRGAYHSLRLQRCIDLSVSYTHLRAHETDSYLVCRLLLE